MQEQFLTRTQAGKYLHDKWGFGGASVLAEAHQAGTGPVFVKPGAKVFYTKASIDAWAQAIMLDPFKKAGINIEPEPKAKEPAQMEQPTKYDEAACEAEIIAKGKTSPRVTPDQIDAIIVTADYFQLRTLTICVITLWNGFTVTGESACASPDNYDAEIGKKLAFAQAREKIWALEGYRLKSLLAHEDESTADPNKAVKSDGAWVSIGIARLLERAKKAGVAEPKRQDLFHAAQALCVAIAKVGE